MAGDNLNAADKVEAQGLKAGESTSLSSAVDFNKEQRPLAFKPENRDKKLAPDFQLDFSSTDIYTSGLGDYSNLGKSATTLDLYPKGKMISFDVSEFQVAQAGNKPETFVRTETLEGKDMANGGKTETLVGKDGGSVVKTEDQTGKPADAVVKDGDQAGKPTEAVAKTVEFPPHPVHGGETYWSIAKDHLKETGGHDPSDTEVMNYMKVLAKHNGLTVEQAAHIDERDVVHFPPEKQAAAAGAEKTLVAKDGDSDGKAETQRGKDGAPDGKVETQIGNDGGPDGKVEVQAQKSEQGADVVVPLNLFPDEQNAENQPKVEAKQPEQGQPEPEVRPEAVPNHTLEPKVVEANKAVPTNPEEKFEPTDFTA